MSQDEQPTYDIPLLKSDMVLKGWLPMDLARKADVSHMTVARFLSGEIQTPRVAKKLATALGHSLKRYVILGREVNV